METGSSLGRMPGEQCLCKGPLVVRVQIKLPEMGRIGGGGRGSGPQATIKDMVCRSCGLMYACQLHGQDRSLYLQKQVAQVSPTDARPSDPCAKCGQSKLDIGYFNQRFPYGITPTDYIMGTDKALASKGLNYGYCPDCLTVRWVEPAKG